MELTISEIGYLIHALGTVESEYGLGPEERELAARLRAERERRGWEPAFTTRRDGIAGRE
jgi:hypothetical protein